MDRFSEKRLRNKKFRCTEEKILIVLLSVKDRISLRLLIHQAHISRSTFYRHHKNINEIPLEYEKYFLKNCRKAMSKHMKKNDSDIKALFQRIIIFLSANKSITEYLMRQGNRDIIEKIVLALKPKIIASSRIKDGEMYMIYAKETAGLIEEWCNAGFNLDDINVITNKIIYITDRAYSHLNPLSSFDSAKREHK